MIRTPKDVRIEGIRPTNAGSWAVVGSRPVGHDDGRVTVLVTEFSGLGAQAKAVDAAGTNKAVRS